MRFYEIALFLFIFNAVLGFINTVNPYNYQIAPEPWSLPQPKLVNYTVIDISPLGAFTTMFGDFIYGAAIFASAFSYATIRLPSLLTQVGLPSSMATMFSSIIWFIYIAAIVQFVANRVIE